MAINKLNLNGTVYDIGEAEGTNTAESIVEFDSNDELDPSVADESVALIKSGDTHKSLWEKMSAGMKNIRYLLKQVTSLNSALVDKENLLSTQTITVDNIDLDASGYLNSTVDCSRSGYTALGIVGVRCENASSSGTGVTRVFANRFYLSNSTTITYRLTNYYSAAAKVAVYFTVLYVAD